MNLRITERQYREVRKLTSASFLPGVDFPSETGCILLLSRNTHPLNPALLVAEVLPPTEDSDLVERSSDGLVFASSYLRRALLRVRERGLAGFLTVHTHPGADRQVGFSWYDNDNDPPLMTNLYELQPEGIFGSIVLGKHSAAARVWHPDASRYDMLDTLVITGEGLEWLPLDGSTLPPPPQAAAIFDRSLALTGHGALSRLSRMRVGIVGASGTGSLVAELLVRAGVGEIVIFEFDRIEDVNLNRVLHSRRRDAEARADKAVRLAEALNDLGLPSRVTVVKGGDIRRKNVALELRCCDAVFGCIDRDWPRLILCEAAYQYLIPYIDIGTEIGVAEERIQSLDSRVSYVAPGRACLVCSGIVSMERVRLESLSEEERDRVISMGYSEDIRLTAPAVMDLNMRAASYGMLVLRHLLQPFLDIPLPTHIKETLTNFSVKRIYREEIVTCSICGADGRVGIGDARRLTTSD